MSCKMMTAILRDQGVDAEYVSLEDIVPDNDDGADESGSLDQAFYDKLANALAERIAQCGPRVPVVTGQRSVQLYWNRILNKPQVSLDTYQGPYCARLAEDTQIFCQRSSRSVCRLLSCKYGKRLTESSLQTRGKFLQRDLYPSYHPTRPPS